MIRALSPRLLEQMLLRVNNGQTGSLFEPQTLQGAVVAAEV